MKKESKSRRIKKGSSGPFARIMLIVVAVVALLVLRDIGNGIGERENRKQVTREDPAPETVVLNANPGPELPADAESVD